MNVAALSVAGIVASVAAGNLDVNVCGACACALFICPIDGVVDVLCDPLLLLFRLLIIDASGPVDADAAMANTV
jgi:hypothetical protein